MQTSASIAEISRALVGFHKEVGKVPKDSTNPFFKSRYASLSNILDAISVPLTNNGLAIVQFPEAENGLTTRLVHASGEWMESTYQMKSIKETPQDRGSAMTYQRRYAVGAILSLNIDEDDDGNHASGKEKSNWVAKEVKPTLPVISNEQFKKINERIAAGELEVYYKAVATYSMEKKQADLLKQAYDEAKKVKR